MFVQSQRCPNCNKSIQKTRLPLHVHMCSTIKLRQSQIYEPQHYPDLNNYNAMGCMFCHNQIPTELMEAHVSICDKRVLQCEYCKNRVPISQTAEHRRFCNNQQKNGNEKQKSSSLMQSFKNTMNSFEKMIVTQGNKLSDKCNKYLSESKSPTIEALRKFRDQLEQSLGNIFGQIAYSPNARPMPKDKIQQINKGMYKSLNNGKQEQLCTICYCQLQDQQPIKILECRHIFHPQCIDKWMKINSRCPVCKNDQLNPNSKN